MSSMESSRERKDTPKDGDFHNSLASKAETGPAGTSEQNGGKGGDHQVDLKNASFSGQAEQRADFQKEAASHRESGERADSKLWQQNSPREGLHEPAEKPKEPEVRK